MRQHSFSVQEERCDRGVSLGAQCPRAVGFKRVRRSHPFALEVQEGGFANKFAAPPVENNDDIIEWQCLHFLLKKPPPELYRRRRLFLSVIPFYPTNLA